MRERWQTKTDAGRFKVALTLIRMATEVRLVVSSAEVCCSGLATSMLPVLEEIKDALIGLEFSMSIGQSNSDQFESGLDQIIAARLIRQGWIAREDRDCPQVARPDIGWAARPDLLIERSGAPKIIIEVEKSDKRKVWDDLMKLWLLVDGENADLGLLICPTNYASRTTDWNLFDYARRSILLLQHAAQVPSVRLSKLAVIGYTQRLLDGSNTAPWNKAACKRLKPERSRI